MADLGFKCLRDGDYYGLALALGTADVSLWELANAYRTLANKGIWNPPTFHLNHSGAARRRVFSHATAFLISDILSDRGARSITFGLENPLATQFWSAVKTGTSMDMRDNWCIGYSNTYTVGVWAGNFSGEPMWNVSGMTGAAPIWFEIMNHLHHGAVSHPPRMPKGVVERTLRFAAAGFRFKERFLKGTEKRVLSPCRPKVRPKILYPPHNAILALDPDIPAEQQRVAFRQSKNTFNVTWVLNQKVLGRGPMLLWKPDRGSYRLSLVTPYGKAKDTVAFSVR
jgi:penicillin-binding protein 1C